MPSFSVSVENLKIHGPLINIALSPSSFAANRLRSMGKDVLSNEVSAMLDTGASRSVMSASLPFIKQIENTGVVNLKTPATGAMLSCYNYSVTITFSSDIQIETDIVAVPYLNDSVECLIGRDILKHAILIYNGEEETITLSF